MDIIHGMNGSGLPRLVAAALAERLAAMPVVVVTGARQTGKSTLVQGPGAGGAGGAGGGGGRGGRDGPQRVYRSLDDLDVLDAAQREPETLVGGSDPVTLDEIQRAPELLAAVKRAVDRQRRPGQFLLTGSANLALMRGVSESLAGRASSLTLWPLTRREQLGLGTCGRWEALLATPERDWVELLRGASKGTKGDPNSSVPGSFEAWNEDWRELARRGGFPTPSVHMKTTRERTIWFEGYVRTYLERDLQELSAISSLADFRRLMRAACLRLGGLVNQTELGRDVGLPQPTVHRYLNLLEVSYVLLRLPAFSINRTKRLIKSPKLYWSDTGLALHLAGAPEPDGAHFENLVLHDLIVWRDARLERAEVAYWRTAEGQEVDFVVEAGDHLLPIEVKASATPRLGDASHLRTFRAEYGDRTRAGLLLHTGDAIEWLTPDVLAVPWWSVI